MPLPSPNKNIDPSRVIFLDRDGVINHDSPDYIKGLDEFHLLPRSLEALALLSRKGWTVIIITNQSAIGRGLISLPGLNRIHTHLKKTVADHGGNIADIFFCPHLPEEDCLCRKPKPEMIRQAAEKFGIVLNRAVMVGDRATDILCGQNAGCGRTVLVRTGAGHLTEKQLASTDENPTRIADDLYDAVKWIVK
ncbi:MAG: D-glycero-beta-D-manno-heptose-1,7-bisphosphate 7-phosphatase [Deltaproteobacteria bacterium]|nr:MAG: D-glycero-beta-D-manno-heptose-1,7-bisphosphate 7-phosphatase [Deltaproteobacteria bacterium]